MKRLLFAIFILVLSIRLFPQLPEFSRIYPYTFCNFYWVEQINDGYLLQSYFTNTNDSMAIVKLNFNGDLEWNHTFRYTQYPTIYPKTTVAVDSDLIISIRRSNSPANGLLIDSYSGDGDSLWSKTYNTNYGWITLVKAAKINEDILIGLGGNFTKIGVVCLDKDGNFKWEKFNDLISGGAPNDMVLLPDSSFLFSTNTGMVKLNKFGTIVSQNSNIKNITKLNLAENGYVIGVAEDTLYKLDYDGNLVWRKFFQNKKFWEAIYSPSVYYIASIVENYHRFLLTINENGEVLKTVQLSNEIKTLALCSDGGLIMAGNRFVQKTDSTGIIKYIKYVNPSGGEQINCSSNMYISWYSLNIDFVHIEMSTNGGNSWNNIISYYPSSGSFNWSVPVINSDSCLIRVKDSYDFSINDVSDTFFSIKPFSQHDYIAANEVFMWVGNNGDGSHDPNTDGSGFYWPGGINNTGKSAIFQDGLCWGGKINGETRVNGTTYRSGLRPGNILQDGTAADPFDLKYRVYKIKKNWEYLPPSPERDKYEYNFLNWPADFGAPWKDNNNDGIYTPGIDQPDYVGDEVLFYVANDFDTAASRFTYGSNPIGLEFQTTIYAFDRDDLKNVVFKKYKIINKGFNNVTDMYFGYWADDDLGDANDDYVGCDTLLNLSFSYNSSNNDGLYGSPPPAVGHMLLQTPRSLSTENDSAYFDGKWVNGFKNIPLSSNVIFIGGVSDYRDPQAGVYAGTIELYNYMQGKFWNGSNFIDPVTGLVTKFVLPGDPVAGIGWYEGDGWPGGAPPFGDRRYIISAGTCTMAPSDTQEVVIAILINKGTDRLNSLSLLKQDAAYYRDQFYNNFPVSVEDKNSTLPDEFILYQNYPNPFNPTTKIQFTLPSPSEGEGSGVRFSTLKIYDILGREITTLINKELAPGNYEVEFNASTLASGVYFYRLEAGSFFQTKKMILIR